MKIVYLTKKTSHSVNKKKTLAQNFLWVVTAKFKTKKKENWHKDVEKSKKKRSQTLKHTLSTEKVFFIMCDGLSIFEDVLLKTKKLTQVYLWKKKGGFHLSNPTGTIPLNIPTPWCYIFESRKGPRIQIRFQLSSSECRQHFFKAICNFSAYCDLKKASKWKFNFFMLIFKSWRMPKWKNKYHREKCLSSAEWQSPIAGLPKLIVSII